MATDEELRDLDRKLKQLKLDYERYFLGTRPREPVMLRGEVDKLIVIYSNSPIQNTALRFRYNSICSRYQALRRQWNDILRRMEAGTYSRQVFKANLHDRERGVGPPKAGGGKKKGASEADIYAEYRDARLACGQGVKSLSRQKLDQMLEKQKAQLKKRYGDAKFKFRVVVEDGKAKLKASRVKS